MKSLLGRFLRATPVVAVVVLAGCGGPVPPPSEELPPADEPVSSVDQSAELRAALDGGDVDHDAYLAGFQRYSACLAEQGHVIVMRDEVAGRPVLQYAIPGAAVDSGADEECYHREFEPLDTAWQLANEDTSPWAETARECLLARGIEPGATLSELHVQLEDAGIDHIECLSGG